MSLLGVILVTLSMIILVGSVTCIVGLIAFTSSNSRSKRH